MESNYTYNTQHECLQEVMLISSGNTVIQNKYKYNLDLVDSILGITNTANPKNIAEKNKVKFGGAYSHSYTYDGINRLVSASSKAKTASYWLDMTYGIMGEPLTKKQKVDSSKVAQSYAFAYLYEDSKHPTVPSQIGHNHYTYDAGGNPLTIMNDSTNTTREMYWDEDNRLMVLSDNGKTSRYTYNAAGERIMKSYGTMEGVYINGAPQGITFHETDNFTLYPASILSVNKNRFTKHYFIGDKRVASRIGMGLFNNVYGRNGSYVTAGQQDYAERMNQIQKQKEAYYKQQGIAPGVPTEKGAYGEPENTGVGYNAALTELGNHDVPQGWIQTPKPNTTPNTNPGPPVSWNDPSNPDDPQTGYGYIPNDTTKEETFFYHSDHLGSTSYITDDKANITQYDAYLPYGELLIDEHSSSEDLPYKFNGKQFDDETGLYYYGARYMNPMASIWYGVDPLAEKYINIGSYIYCHSSPIMLIDPTGEGDYYNKSGKLLGNDGVKNNKAYLATSVLTDKKGIVTSATDKSLLPVTNDVLNQYANTVAQESSGNKQESYALASAISNLSKYKKKSILATLKTEGIYGFRDGGYKTDYEGNAEYSMEAVINALTNGKDYSNGAIRWDGFDLAARGFNHPKPKTAGVEISPADFMHFKAAWPAKLIKAYSAGKYTSFSSNFHSGSHPATYGSNKGYVLYSSSAAYGRTMFWKANLNATRKVAGKIETYKHTY